MYLQLFVSIVLIGCQSVNYDNSAWAEMRNFWDSQIIEKKDSTNINWEAATPFIAHIIRESKDQNVPSEIALLPYLLSHYNNQMSMNNNLGLWQIKKANCKLYNLICNEYYDERLHPAISTKAAIKRIKNLKTHSISWEKAIEAFYDEQHLLNKHTLNKIAPLTEALRILKYNVNNYHENLPFIVYEEYFEPIELKYDVNIMKIAELSEIDPNIWLQLNAYHVKMTTTAKHRSILIPSNSSSNIKIPNKNDLETNNLHDKIKESKNQLLYAMKLARNTQPIETYN